jgi:hypothetical protein
MKVGCPANVVGYKGALLAFIIVAGSMVVPAYCQTYNITLLVQQTPNEGGAVTPIAGVYTFEPESEVTLTATPNPGYEFIYWLGDVSDHDSKNTVVLLDKPKIVIAVFEQAQNGLDIAGVPSGGGGRSMTTASSVGYSQPASLSSTVGAQPQTQSVVYSSGSETLPVIPEPATGIFLTLGSLFAFAKRRRKKLV